jgi:hypothetical protein
MPGTEVQGMLERQQLQSGLLGGVSAGAVETAAVKLGISVFLRKILLPVHIHTIVTINLTVTVISPITPVPRHALRIVLSAIRSARVHTVL